MIKQLTKEEHRNETLIQNKLTKLNPRLFNVLRKKIIEYKVKTLKRIDDFDIIFGNLKLEEKVEKLIKSGVG